MSDPRDLTDGELDSIQILALSEIIREVDGNHSLGAAALAEAILSHPGSRWGRPSPAPAGEVAELVAALRIESSRCTCTLLTTDDLRRAADLLDELVQVAYAASDFICGTHFPEFANEHGGIDRLTADLRRLVAQFEYGPRPVPGVDVPGPDGDWGGLGELCKAEGVDLRIGVPLLQRAQEAWKNASQAAPAPVGMIPVEYCDLDSGARIVSEPSEEGPGGCWVVLNSRHVSPLTEFPTAEAAWIALQAAHALPLPSGEVE